MLDTVLVPSLAALAAAWSGASFVRGQHAIAAGAATTSAVLAVSWAAAATRLGPWLEGGYGMSVLALCGSYALGAAMAARLSPGRGPRVAALAGVALTFVGAALFYGEAVSAVDEAVRHAAPETAALIRAAGRAEAVRTLEWGGLLGALTLALLVRPPRHRLPAQRSLETPRAGARAPSSTRRFAPVH